MWQDELLATCDMVDYVEILLLLYPSLKVRETSVYPRDERKREEDFGVLKLLWATQFKHIEEDLRTLAAPAPLTVRENEVLYTKTFSGTVRWASHYQECFHLEGKLRTLQRTVPNLCVEFGMTFERTSESAPANNVMRLGPTSNLLKFVTTMEVAI